MPLKMQPHRTRLVQPTCIKRSAPKYVQLKYSSSTVAAKSQQPSGNTKKSRKKLYFKCLLNCSPTEFLVHSTCFKKSAPKYVQLKYSSSTVAAKSQQPSGSTKRYNPHKKLYFKCLLNCNPTEFLVHPTCIKKSVSKVYSTEVQLFNSSKITATIWQHKKIQPS